MILNLDNLYDLIVGNKPKEEKKAREPTKINYCYNNLLDKERKKS